MKSGLKRIFLSALCLLLLLSPLAGCGKKGEKPIILLNKKAPAYTVVTGKAASDDIKTSAKALLEKLNALADTPFPSLQDEKERGEKSFEILVGNTNRKETADVLAALPPHTAAMAIQNGHLVLVGTDDNMTAVALYEFEKRILQNPEKNSNGRIEVSPADCFTVTEADGLGLARIIQNGYHYEIAADLVIESTPVDSFLVGQGAASDGTYAYFILRAYGNTNGSVITKYRLDTGEFVAKSGRLELGHGNDMTYNSDTHELVIAHGQEEGNILTFVNPDTLTFLRDKTITKGAGAITYCSEQGRYALSQGGKTLHILTSTFGPDHSYSRRETGDYTPQGMGSDATYIYFPMSKRNDNILEVYSWSGKHAATVPLPIAPEAESMFCVNGNYYVSCYYNGARLYQLSFSITFQ